MKIKFKKFLKFINKKIFFNVLTKLYERFYINFFLKKFFLSNINKKIGYKNIHYINNSKNNLSLLCEKYGSDKGYLDINKSTPYGWKAHSYSNFYYNMFNHYKDKIKLIFECGIGTNNLNFPCNMSLNGKPGASLRVWRDYFINSQVYGADIDKNSLFKEDRIETFYVNQLDSNSIEKMWQDINKIDFDIIIDDGLHTYEAAITLFLNSFDKLKKDGIYIIEDINFIYIDKIYKQLSSYNPELIILNDNLNKNKSNDNNLVLIRKY
jgi:hypothetical protein